MVAYILVLTRRACGSGLNIALDQLQAILNGCSLVPPSLFETFIRPMLITLRTPDLLFESNLVPAI